MEGLQSIKKTDKKTFGYAFYATVIVLYLFFSSNSSTGHMILFALLALSSFAAMIVKYKKIIIFKTYYAYILFVIFAAVTIIIADGKARFEGIKFCLGAVVFGLMAVVCSNLEKEFFEILGKVIFVILAIFTLATVVQSFFPQIIDKICKILLSPEALAENRKFVSSGNLYSGMPGLTSQIGINAFYMALFVGFCEIKALKEKSLKNKIFYFVALFAGLFALIKTNKRGMLLFTVILFFVVLILYNKRQIKKTAFAIVLCCFVGGVVLLFTDIGAQLSEKFLEGGLSGRDKLWEAAIQDFKAHPILGIGIDSYSTKYGLDTHNIYLQVLCETGIIGFALFAVFLLRNSYMAIISCLQCNENDPLKTICFFASFIQGIFILWGFSGNTFYDQFVLCWYMMSVAAIDFVIYTRRKSYENRNIDFSKHF